MTDIDAIGTAQNLARRVADEAAALADRLQALATNPATVPTGNQERVDLGLDIEGPALIAESLKDLAFHFHGMSD